VNEFLANDWIERVDRLALGLEPIDAGCRTRIAHPIQVTFDEEARGVVRSKVDRHDSCLHALLYRQPGVTEEKRVRLRFVERDRRFVPRLISFPILKVTTAQARDYRNRVRRPVLFPGAAYDITCGTTGIRGRVERNGKPMRWARVRAKLDGTITAVGYAHGDDRGEFLLLISSGASMVGDLVSPLAIRVDVFGPAVPPVANPATLPLMDPLWDLPEEAAQELDTTDPEDDPISAGESAPANYTATTGRTIDVPLGRIHSETAAFTIP